MILYEYPFNERIRTYLRLEHLLRRLGELIASDSSLLHHYALVTIFETMDVASRADLKSDLLRDLDKNKTLLNSYRGNPAISETALNEAIEQLEHSFSTLTTTPGKAGQALVENEWLMSIRSRVTIPGGTCEFDLPSYFAWRHHPPAARRADIERWAATLSPLAEAIHLLLRLLRQSDMPCKAIATNGQFQMSLPQQGRCFQLLRLCIDEKDGMIPEISGNRIMMSVRFMYQDGSDDRLHATTKDVPFEMTLCA